VEREGERTQRQCKLRVRIIEVTTLWMVHVHTHSLRDTFWSGCLKLEGTLKLSDHSNLIPVFDLSCTYASLFLLSLVDLRMEAVCNLSSLNLTVLIRSNAWCRYDRLRCMSAIHR
jgi:hypothetical protein